MNSRDKILATVKTNQPALLALPDISSFKTNTAGNVENFASVLTMIGGKAVSVKGFTEIERAIFDQHSADARIVTNVDELAHLNKDALDSIPGRHDLENVDVAILRGQFGVAENGAVWLTEEDMHFRVLPFITQHLVVIVEASQIVPKMHDAYGIIGEAAYGYGAFVAGPSKTADIEQSLVIGAHGPRSLTAFIIGN